MRHIQGGDELYIVSDHPTIQHIPPDSRSVKPSMLIAPPLPRASLRESPPAAPARSQSRLFRISIPLTLHENAASFRLRSFIGEMRTTPLGRVSEPDNSSGSAQPLPEAVAEMTR